MSQRAAEVFAPLTPIMHDRSLGFEHTTTRRGYAYWNEIRGTRSMPDFGDLSPRGMKEFIANVSVIDMHLREDGAVDYSVRLTGEHVREHYGPIAHRKLSEFLPPEMVERWRRSLELVATTHQPLRVHGRMSYGDRTWLNQESLLAPLSAADRAGAFFLVTAWWPDKDEP
jgi:hypothetical protein